MAGDSLAPEYTPLGGFILGHTLLYVIIDPCHLRNRYDVFRFSFSVDTGWTELLIFSCVNVKNES
jgi:hypothetical protein